jgi:hypothetical protein
MKKIKFSVIKMTLSSNQTRKYEQTNKQTNKERKYVFKFKVFSAELYFTQLDDVTA